MICPMIDPSFAAFGRIEQLHSPQADLYQPILLQYPGEVKLYCFSHDTSWDYVDGMTVLLIQDGTGQRPLYLDRPVTV